MKLHCALLKPGQGRPTNVVSSSNQDPSPAVCADHTGTSLILYCHDLVQIRAIGPRDLRIAFASIRPYWGAVTLAARPADRFGVQIRKPAGTLWPPTRPVHINICR